MKKDRHGLLREKTDRAPVNEMKPMERMAPEAEKPALREEMEKGDLLAMVLSAFLVFGGVIGGILIVMALTVHFIFQ